MFVTTQRGIGYGNGQPYKNTTLHKYRLIHHTSIITRSCLKLLLYSRIFFHNCVLSFIVLKFLNEIFITA